MPAEGGASEAGEVGGASTGVEAGGEAAPGGVMAAAAGAAVAPATVEAPPAAENGAVAAETAAAAGAAAARQAEIAARLAQIDQELGAASERVKPTEKASLAALRPHASRGDAVVGSRPLHEPDTGSRRVLSTAAPRPLPVQVSEEEAAASKAVRRQQAEERQAEITARLAQIEEQLQRLPKGP